MPTIVALSGSPSPTSRSAKLLRHVAHQLPGYDISYVAVRDLPAEALLGADINHPAIVSVAQSISDADGLIVATPVYKAAYSGLLKTLLDLLPQFALAGKTVLPLATGGTIAHVLAIDYALRPVLSSMGARHVVAGAFVLDKAITESETGIALDEASQSFLDGVIAGFVDGLPTRTLQAA